MGEQFDPYYTWLAIPPEEQPPTYYRLLGLRPFEDNRDVIENAGDQRMAHLRTFQSGKRAQTSQRLLNEVAAAKVCLLSKERKEAYDLELRRRMEREGTSRGAPIRPGPAADSSSPLTEFLDTVQSETLTVGSPRAVLPTPRTSLARPRARQKLPKHYAVVAALAVLVLIVVAVIAFSIFATGDRATGDTAIVLHLPEGARTGLTVRIDGRQTRIPQTGKLKYVCQPGKHRIQVTRPDFRPHHESVTVKRGYQIRIVPVWLPLSNLILEWPVAERGNAVLEIDGEPRDVAELGASGARDEIRLSVDAGPHKIRFSREGFEPFERTVLILEGDVARIRPFFSALADTTAGPGEGAADETATSMQDEGPPTLSDLVEAETPEEAESAGEPIGRQRGVVPVPSGEIHDKLVEQLQLLYDPSQAATPSEKVALAQKMIVLARKSAETSAERYVLLETAIYLVGGGGDAALMLRIVEWIGSEFDVDSLEFKRNLYVEFARSAVGEPSIESLVETLEGLTEEAIAEDRYEVARDVVEAAYTACQKTQGRRFRKQVLDLRKEVVEISDRWEEVEAALKILMTDPDEKQANLKIGSWYCFGRFDWQRGLPYLAKCGDNRLATVASRELAQPPNDPDGQVELADTWWALAETAQGPTGDSLKLHAAGWYRRAQPNVGSTLVRARLADRLDQAADVERALAAAKAKPLDPDEILWRGQWVDLLRWVDLTRDRVEGEWQRDNRALTVTSSPQARIMLPVAVHGSYELAVQFTRHKGDDKMIVGLPVGANQCAVSLSGWQGQARGIELIDGQGAENNVSTKRPGTLENGHRYSLAIRVQTQGDDAHIEVTLDDEPYLKWTGPRASLSFPPLWKLPRSDRPGLGGSQLEMTFHAAKLRLAEGEATIVTEADSAASEPSSP